jgi:hypothetical protein
MTLVFKKVVELGAEWLESQSICGGCYWIEKSTKKAYVGNDIVFYRVYVGTPNEYEIVGEYPTEYSAMKMAAFHLAAALNGSKTCINIKKT